MKKNLVLGVLFFLTNSVIYSIDIIEKKSLQKIFTPSNWLRQKKVFNNKLKQGVIDPKKLNFNGIVLQNIDLSGMVLKDIDFSGCKFIRSNLEGTDLRGTKFDNVDFEDIKLNGALLCDGFLFNGKSSHLDLVKQYSELMTSNAEEKKIKAASLNKLLGPLSLKLACEKLNGLNLTKINFQNAELRSACLENTNLTGANLIKANLSRANLRGTWLSEKVQIPHYSYPNELFIKWAYGKKAEQMLYQKLVNARFNIFEEISNELLKKVQWTKRNLQNADLSFTELQTIDFSYSNLEGAFFTDANLTSSIFKNCNLINGDFGMVEAEKVDFRNSDLINAFFFQANIKDANLINTNLKGAHFKDTELQGVRLSENVQVPNYKNINELFDLWVYGTQEEKIMCQKLVSCGLNIFEGVTQNRFKTADLKHKNLTYANLSKAQLQNIDLTKAHLENSDLSYADLSGVNLTEAYLNNASFCNANLIGAILKKSCLKGTNFSGARLSDNYVLPNRLDEDSLIDLYNICEDTETKSILEQILIGKEIIPEKIKEEEKVNIKRSKRLAKKRKILSFIK